MPYLIGTDEAGFGPNLGPLVIGATLWRAPAGIKDSAALYAALSPVVTAKAPRGGAARIVIGDSKRVYKSGEGLAGLERAVLPMAASATGGTIGSWRDAWSRLVTGGDGQLDRAPWLADFDVPLPTALDPRTLAELSDAFRDRLEATDVRLVAIAARVLFPPAYNEAIGRWGMKSTLLSVQTLGLVRQVLEMISSGDGTADEPVSILCDKHGGRDKYAPVLFGEFPDSMPQTFEEGRTISRYRITHRGRPCDIRFQMKGESELPIAAASLVAKYLRELAMRALNAFWQRHIPDLCPTAGYPEDAKRFAAQIGPVADSLGISRDIYWRVK